MYLSEGEVGVAGGQLVDRQDDDHGDGGQCHEQSEGLGPRRKFVCAERERPEVDDVVDQYHLQSIHFQYH